MDWIKWPIKIELTPTGISFDGVQMSYMVFAETVNQIMHPDPRKWYRLERVGDVIQINVRLTEDEPNGTQIGTTGNSPGAGQEDTRRERAQTPHP